MATNALKRKRADRFNGYFLLNCHQDAGANQNLPRLGFGIAHFWEYVGRRRTKEADLESASQLAPIYLLFSFATDSSRHGRTRSSHTHSPL